MAKFEFVSPSSSIMSEADRLFRVALTDYESKNYKKALASVDKILKKAPHHSPTIALKALIVCFYHPNQPESKDVNALVTLSEETLAECQSLIERASEYDPKNSIAAHLSALYYRQIKDYAKAAHYYTVAYSNNPYNKAILRDLSSCLSQLRKFPLLTKTRFDYLQAEPGYRQNYSTTAMAYDLNGEYESAIKICEQIEEIIKDKLIEEDMVENSEAIIYKATLYIKLEQYEKALEYIDQQLDRTDKFRCYDTFGLLEMKYELLMKLGKYNEGQLVIRQLLIKNPDNIDYYRDLFKCLQIEDNVDLKLKVLTKLAKFYPRSDLPKYLPLTFLKGELFESHLDAYMSGLFKRGVPSAFNAIKTLYKEKDHPQIILKVAEKYESSEKDPLNLTWIKYFVSQHYYRLGDYENSMKKINEAIQITPTLIELYMYKARILKHQGRLADAANEMNTARRMDLQDRFVNTKTVKYYFRANMIEEAIKTASLFTKNDEEPTGVKDLHQVQACWFIAEYAEALARLFKEKLSLFQELEKKEPSATANDDGGNQDDDEINIHLIKKQVSAYLGLSLQRFFSIFSIYEEYYDDQFDFHFYAFRKGTFRAYHETIQWSDELFHQPFIGRIYSDVMTLLQYTVENKDLLERALDLSTTTTRRSKKDKKDEIKWKESMLKYNKVYDSDSLATQLVENIVLKKDYSRIEKIENLIKVQNPSGKPETIDFLNGQFNYDLIEGRYVVALASLRKVKELARGGGPTAERAKLVLDEMTRKLHKFIDAPSDDPKIQSLQKIVKLGLMRN